MTTADQMRDRRRELFVVANERIFRDVLREDNRREPSDDAIARVRAASIEQFNDIDSIMTATMDARSIARLEGMTDEAIIDRYSEAMRPQLLAAFAPSRPS